MSYREHADRLAVLVAEMSGALHAPKGSYAERWKEGADKAVSALRSEEMADRQGDLLSRARGNAQPAVKTRSQRFAELLVERMIASYSLDIDPEAIRRELDTWNLCAMNPEQEQFSVKLRALIEGALEELDQVTQTSQPATTENA